MLKCPRRRSADTALNLCPKFKKLLLEPSFAARLQFSSVEEHLMLRRTRGRQRRGAVGGGPLVLRGHSLPPSHAERPTVLGSILLPMLKIGIGDGAC